MGVVSWLAGQINQTKLTKF
ncbi:Protein of unknown function [Weissella confusa LBAE C39-2]|nr:Protein of unknown function [Weissella confusa LBAE C39-2]